MSFIDMPEQTVQQLSPREVDRPRNRKKIGFIGLGEMGKPMAKNLVKKGFPVTVCGHTSKGSVEELAALGASVVNTPKEVAEANQIIIIVVRTTSQIDEVVYGKGHWQNNGIWQGIKPGSILLISSTAEPDYCQDMAKNGEENGVIVLDSPVSGGLPRSEAGTLTFMVGGDRQAYDECSDIFRAMGEKIFYLGNVGNGQICKLVNNYMMIITAYATSEALALGIQAGLKVEDMVEVAKVSTGNSSTIQRWDLMIERKRQYKKDGSGSISNYEKDLGQGLKLAESLGVDTPLGDLVSKMDPVQLFPENPT